MRADRVTILKPGFQLICIDGGALPPDPVIGKTYEIEHAVGKHPLAYYVIKGTRVGAIQRYWEDSQRDGKIRLTVIAEGDDPTLDGVPLPVRNGSQLTEHQKKHTVCGYLIKGKFKCTRCALKHGLTYPDAIAVYPINIIPYSQDCTECKLLIFEIWRSAKGGPLCLFE
jgi:hypothetical protein